MLRIPNKVIKQIKEINYKVKYDKKPDKRKIIIKYMNRLKA